MLPWLHALLSKDSSALFAMQTIEIQTIEQGIVCYANW